MRRCRPFMASQVAALQTQQNLNIDTLFFVQINDIQQSGRQLRCVPAPRFLKQTLGKVTREQDKLLVRKRTPRSSHPTSLLTFDLSGQFADKRISPSATRWSNNSFSNNRLISHRRHTVLAVRCNCMFNYRANYSWRY